MQTYYDKDTNETIDILKSNAAGLSSKEARARIESYGYNELPKEGSFTLLKLLVNQFKNALILLLIFAGLISLFLGETVESIAIFSIVVLNALLGFFQEYKAEKAMEALQKMSAPDAVVMRDGSQKRVPVRDIVPGDVLLLEAGDIVPADSRIIEVFSLQIDEASLTGESVPQKKTADRIDKKGLAITDQRNMAFMGCSVTYGKGRCIVTGTGISTEFGKIASSLKSTKETKTPLQIKFEKLAKQISIAAAVLIVFVLISGTLQGTLTFAKMLLFALVLAVATIPSALPVIVTVGLSKGANDLAKKNMLIKKLPAAESLGAATAICSDKTGTITKNQMTVTSIYHDKNVIDVSGTGYSPSGDFSCEKKRIDPSDIEKMLRIGYLCNNSELTRKEGKYSIIGDPTEGSLVVLAKKAGLDDDSLRQRFTSISELPFDSDRKRMSVIFRDNKARKKEAYVKGAPDLMLKRCNRIYENKKVRKLTKKDRDRILKKNDEFAKNALRVLCFAYKEIDTRSRIDIENVENDMVFMGLVGMIDPPRDEVKHAIEDCAKAGISVTIITGDQASTTKAIADKIGLLKEGDLVLTGAELDEISDDRLEDIVEDIRIIARAMPIQKLQIVEALQKKGHIVAMTGDGVNDAPALKKADIGIAMGITGTDVAKEVSRAVLADDNFATIVKAIEEGRNIYDKMIKSAKYLLSCNSGEIATVLIAILMSFPLPLLPLQILLINMLTDTSPALGLGFESSEKGIMDRKPREPDEKPITGPLFISILVIGLIMGAGTLFMFDMYKGIDLVKAQTVAFTTLVMFQMFAVLSSRSIRPSWSKLNPFTNMWLLGAVMLSVTLQVAVIYWAPLQSIFGTVSLAAYDWLRILLVSSSGFVFMELSKFMLVRYGRKGSAGIRGA